MSCGAFENMIALDAGGDLGPAEAARLGAHLEVCAPCREQSQRLRESLAALRSLAEDVPGEDALARWRRGLLARIEDEPRRRMGWRWAWAAAGAMALVALVTVPGLLPKMPPQPPPLARLARVLPAAVTPQRPPVTERRRHVRRPRSPLTASGPLLVKLETPDPNVVIYWIIDRKGN